MFGTAGSLSKAIPSSCGSFSSSSLSNPASRAAVWSSSSASASLSDSSAATVSSTAGLVLALALVLETLDEALSPDAGLLDSDTVTFSTFPGATLTVVFFAGFSWGSRKSSARFLVDLVDFAGAAVAGVSLLTSFLTLVVSVFLRADLGAGFSAVVVLTFLVVTLGSDAPVMLN